MTPRLRGPYVSTAWAASVLDVSERTIRRWCKEGRLRVKRKRTPGAPLKVVRSSVERMRQEKADGRR